MDPTLAEGTYSSQSSVDSAASAEDEGEAEEYATPPVSAVSATGTGHGQVYWTSVLSTSRRSRPVKSSPGPGLSPVCQLTHVRV